MARKDHSALNPPKYELADVSALQAVADGRADEHQQRRAIKWIVEMACQTYQPSFRNGPNGERETVFAEGRRFVGLMIVEKLKFDISTLRRIDEHIEAQKVKPDRDRK